MNPRELSAEPRPLEQIARTDPMVEIVSYERVDSISFGMTPSQVADLLGRPNAEKKNFLRQREQHFGDYTVIFDVKTDTVREISIPPKESGEIIINGHTFSWGFDLFKCMVELDRAPYESSGLVLFFKLGLGMSGYQDNDQSQRSIGAFQRGARDRSKATMVPFSF